MVKQTLTILALIPSLATSIISSMLIALSFSASEAQTLGEDSPLLGFKHEVKLPTPEAASLGRFGEHPVDLSSGLARVSVPIHTVRVSGLELPVSLDYHASGVRVDEVASRVGLGWVLSAGGMIQVTYKGQRDSGPVQLPAGDPSNFQPNIWASSEQQAYQNPSYKFAKDVLDNCSDTEPDVYTYSMLSRSGRFITDGSGNVLTVPFDATRVEPLPEGGYLLTDNKGVRFYFTESELASFQPGCPVPQSRPIEGYCVQTFASKGYWLTKVATPKGDVITLTYEQENYTYPHSRMETVYRKVPNVAGCTSQTFPKDQKCVRYSASFTKRIRLIRSSSGEEVEFGYQSSDRTDLPGSKALSSIIVRHALGGISKRFWLGTSYFDAGYKPADMPEAVRHRLRLDKVWQEGLQTTQGTPIHVFSYDNNIEPRLSYRQDHYGYCNSNSAGTLIPSYVAVGFYGADRSPDPSKIQGGILRRVSYPTGGYTEFLYEPNRDPAGDVVGGVRILAAKSYTAEEALASMKRYEYLKPSTGVSSAMNRSAISNDYYVKRASQRISESATSCTYFIFSSEIDAFHYEFSTGPSKYEYVTEYIGQNSEGGKTTYCYSTPAHFPTAPKGSGDYSWLKGHLLTKTVYAMRSGKLVPVTEETNTYSLYKDVVTSGSSTEHFERALKIGYTSPQISSPFQAASFEFTFYNVLSAFIGLRERTNRIFDETGQPTLVSSVTYEYVPPAAVKRLERGQLSRGEVMEVDYRYAFDFTGAPYVSMKAKNMLDIPVREVRSINNGTVAGAMHTYREESGRFVLNMGYRLALDNPLLNLPLGTTAPDNPRPSQMETRITDTGYDSYGNMVSIKIDGKKVGRVYGYGGSLLLAEAVDASAAEIYYNGFEEVSSARTDIVAKAGLRCGNGFTFTPPANFTPVTESKLTYWLRTGDTWEYRELDYSGGGFTLTGTVDEVRIYPKGAQMTTYTYDPLIGMTSDTDPNGRTTYYEYDSFGRLSLVKDDRSNIIKSYKYNYKQ